MQHEGLCNESNESFDRAMLPLAIDEIMTSQIGKALLARRSQASMERKRLSRE
jgi:hypothetical protein